MSERKNLEAFSTLLGWSGRAAALSGVLFLVLGYVHRDGASWYSDLVVLVLNIVVPLLFLLGLVGTFVRVFYVRVYSKSKTKAGWLSFTGFLMSFAGAAGWLTNAVTYAPGMFRHLGERTGATPPGVQEEECGLCLLAQLYVLLGSPLSWLFVGLSVAGLAAVRRGVLRRWGFLLLAMGLCGWVYQLTDDATGIVDVRSVHVAFGILFGLSWVLLGYALWSSQNRAS